MLDINALHYMHGKPKSTGCLKVNNEDFIVREDLGFTGDGEGEHVLVHIQKNGVNTAFVADELAKFAKVSRKVVSYAGLKDRHAVTQQWFCLQMPGKETPDFRQFNLQGCEVLAVTRHGRKLRIGALKGNEFTVVLRNISDKNDVEQRLEKIAKEGVPNYFGLQRFGRQGNNLVMAMRWANNEISVKERSKRSFYLSAARSAMFNHIASERFAQQKHKQVILGDAVQLFGSGSWFVATENELAQTQQRLNEGDVVLTAPLPGDGDLGTKEAALFFESGCLADQQALLGLMSKERLSLTRRAIIMAPKNLQWQWQDDCTLSLSFYLAAGSFATSVVRELIELGGSDAEVSE